MFNLNKKKNFKVLKMSCAILKAFNLQKLGICKKCNFTDFNTFSVLQTNCHSSSNTLRVGSAYGLLQLTVEKTYCSYMKKMHFFCKATVVVFC